MDGTRVTVTFDFEGLFGMPDRVNYDIAEATYRLLNILDNSGVYAVFFIVGQIVESYPEIVSLLHERGHTIGLHGYRHERLGQLTPPQLQEFCVDLEGAVAKIEGITSSRPRGFRAPYLAAPSFYVPSLYEALAKMGFTWISNCEVRFPDELWRPGRLPRGRSLLEVQLVRQAMVVLLNTGAIFTNRGPRSRRALSTIGWLTSGQPPFVRPEGLVEYPLTSPLDCDLLGLPVPAEPSTRQSLDYAAATLASLFDQSRTHFILSFHDWIIGTSNRPDLLARTLEYIVASHRATFWIPDHPAAARA